MKTTGPILCMECKERNHKYRLFFECEHFGLCVDCLKWHSTCPVCQSYQSKILDRNAEEFEQTLHQQAYQQYVAAFRLYNSLCSEKLGRYRFLCENALSVANNAKIQVILINERFGYKDTIIRIPPLPTTFSEETPEDELPLPDFLLIPKN